MQVERTQGVKQVVLYKSLNCVKKMWLQSLCGYTFSKLVFSLGRFRIVIGIPFFCMLFV